eukprot:TRINITY_DN12498_c1_g12_i1.p1 TRINITY_DN12498_c1_g12~~TRINITY_DN12498_c1_g12_i1.p1  ORF type:complete len:246 (+),score=50.67 TRINITY_DN12498_c1_g12_i1:20-757(+)
MARRFAWSSIHARLHIGRTGVDLQPKTAVLNATAEHRHSIFVFHGLGDSHDGYETLVEDWSQAMPAAKFIVPSAPDYAITQFGGQACPAWYDLTGSSNRDTEECEGLRESCDSIAPLIEEEVQVVGAENVLLLGFSQGGGMAITLGLASPHTFAGLAILSSYLPRPFDYSPERFSAERRRLPVHFFHGDADPVVPLEWGRAAYQKLEEFGFRELSFDSYRHLQHSMCLPELEDIHQMFKKRLRLD